MVVNYLYTGVMESYQGTDHMLFQELLDEYGLEPHYTTDYNITPQNHEENDAMEDEKAEHVFKIKQEIDTTFTPPDHSIDDMDDDDETMKTLDKDDTSSSDSDQEHQDISDMIGRDPGRNDKDQAQNVEKPIPKPMKTEFIDETNEIDDQTVVEQAIGKRSMSKDKSANKAKKIKKEIESDEESEKHSTTNENEEEGEDDWMQDMEKEFAKYKERHDCDICRDGFPSSKEEIDHFYAVWMEKGEKYDEKPLCNVCGKTFTRNSDLKRHLKKHSGVIVGTCPVCKKEFWDAQFLKAHMRKHATGNYIL